MSFPSSRVHAFLDSLLRLPNPDARIRQLAEEIAKDPELGAQVEELLRAATGAMSAQGDQGVQAMQASLREDSAESSSDAPLAAKPHFDKRGDLVGGRFELGETIGQGGMGTVWSARQVRPVKRIVALKLIKRGMDSGSILTRFEGERQALALMNHPHIAAVLDGGTTLDGRPFFVMEMVQGAPITRTCDQHQLDLRQRLELFIQVCDAVHHAHQKGVLHRDLKPSNVLLTSQGEKWVPKVIDFGLAKALHSNTRLAEVSQNTVPGAILGTPLYMAPEQADMQRRDMDTRADVFSLGALLHELLCGDTPIPRAEAADLDALTLLDRVRTQEPTPPSRRVANAIDPDTIARARGVEAKRLVRMLRGELDWITTKALANDRERRYASVAALAEDIGRFLRQEPVAAGPPSHWYQARTFARRHRASVATGAAILVALIGGVIGTSIGLLRAEEKAAGETQAKSVAQDRLEETLKALDILGKIFEDANQYNAKEGKSLRELLGERLELASGQLDGARLGDPLALSNLRTRLGLALIALDRPQQAVIAMRQAYEAREKLLGPEAPLTLVSMSNLAYAMGEAGEEQEARNLYEKALVAQQGVLGPDHRDTLTTASDLAQKLHLAGDRQARRRLEELHDQCRLALGKDDSLTLRVANNLAVLLIKEGALKEALDLNRETYQLLKDTKGPNHLSTLMALLNVAESLKRMDRGDEALPLYQETYERRLQVLGPTHSATLRALGYLATGYRATGSLTRSIALHEEADRRLRSAFGPEHEDTILNEHNLAAAYMLDEQPERAIPHLMEVCRVWGGRLGLDHPYTLTAQSTLGMCYLKIGDKERALSTFKELVRLAEGKLGPNHAQMLVHRENLGLAHLQAGQPHLAEPLFRECLSRQEKTDPKGWKTCNTRSRLGEALLAQKKYAEAEILLKEGYNGLKEQRGQIPPPQRPRIGEAVDRLVRLFLEMGQEGEARHWHSVRLDYPPELIVRPREDGDLGRKP